MIFVNRIIAEYLEKNRDVLVFKRDKRRITGNKEAIILYENGYKYRIGKCVVRPFLQNIEINSEHDLKDCLDAYLCYSGFNNIDRWYEYIRDDVLNGKFTKGYLYEINKLCFYDYNIPLKR